MKAAAAVEDDPKAEQKEDNACDYQRRHAEGSSFQEASEHFEPQFTAPEGPLG